MLCASPERANGGFKAGGLAACRSRDSDLAWDFRCSSEGDRRVGAWIGVRKREGEKERETERDRERKRERERGEYLDQCRIASSRVEPAV